MIREVDLVSYLPEFLREYIELKKILDVQQPEVQLLEDLTEKLKDNQFILFADTQGIEKFEQMLKIQALDDDTLEKGDLVIVPVGHDNHRSIARISSIEYHKKEEAPFPIERIKKIIRKCTDKDFESDDKDI